jgi:hypothetical protein
MGRNKPERAKRQRNYIRCLFILGSPKLEAQKPIALSAPLVHNRAMLAKVCSAAVNGIDAYPVEVEVNAGFGDTLIVMLPGILPTGLGGNGSGGDDSLDLSSEEARKRKFL